MHPRCRPNSIVFLKLATGVEPVHFCLIIFIYTK